MNSNIKAMVAEISEEYLPILEDLAAEAEQAVTLRAENARIRAARKPILARLEMPAGGFSRTQDVMIQASELVVLQAALAGEVKP